MKSEPTSTPNRMTIPAPTDSLHRRLLVEDAKRPTTARLMLPTNLPTTTSTTSLKATNRLMAKNPPELCLPIQLGPLG